jgi:hypothetical protein
MCVDRVAFEVIWESSEEELVKDGSVFNVRIILDFVESRKKSESCKMEATSLTPSLSDSLECSQEHSIGHLARETRHRTRSRKKS